MNDKNATIISVLILVGFIAGSVALADHLKPEPQNKVSFTAQTDMELENVDVIPQKKEKDCHYYSNNLSRDEQKEYRETVLESANDTIIVEGTYKGKFYQLCKDINQTHTIRSEIFQAHLQKNGYIIPNTFQVWMDSPGMVETLGRVKSLNPSTVN